MDAGVCGSDAMKTAREILISWLREMGADGLCYPDMDCGCSVADLCPLDGCINLDECRPARWIAPDSSDADQEMLEDFPEGYFVLVEEQ